MKTFIFLLILVLSFFTYLFWGDHSLSQKEPTTPRLEKFAQTNQESGQKALAPSTPPKNTLPPLTAQNLQEIANLSDDTPKPISEQMTFDMLQKIIVQIRPHYPKESITLNSPMHALLRNPGEKEMFKRKIEATFNLPKEQIKEQMQKSKLLWDWVNLLKEE